MTDQQALDAALAQIDRAFGKAPADAPPRVAMKVWMDPFTEDHVRYWLREQVNSYIDDEDWDHGDIDRMWENIFDDMDGGEHRVIRNPLERMYPPVTLGERVGLFLRRLLGRFQRSQTQKWDAEIARMAPPVPRLSTPGPNDPPF